MAGGFSVCFMLTVLQSGQRLRSSGTKVTEHDKKYLLSSSRVNSRCISVSSSVAAAELFDEFTIRELLEAQYYYELAFHYIEMYLLSSSRVNSRCINV